MANGNLQDIGYGDILSGTRYGGNPLSSIIKALTSTLAQGGYFGTDQSDLSSSELSDYFSSANDEGIYNLVTNPSGGNWKTGDWIGGFSPPPPSKGGITPGGGKMGKGQLQPIYGDMEHGIQLGSRPLPDQRPEYNLDNLLSTLKARYGEGGSYFDETGDFHEGMKSLYGMLQGSKLPSLVETYSQNVGDIGREIQGDLKSLTTQFGVGGKGRRYGTVGSGGRNLAMGGRDKYLSDYYGLKDKESEMQGNLRKQLEEDFMGNIGNWMQYNPTL